MGAKKKLGVEFSQDDLARMIVAALSEYFDWGVLHGFINADDDGLCVHWERTGAGEAQVQITPLGGDVECC